MSNNNGSSPWDLIQNNPVLFVGVLLFVAGFLYFFSNNILEKTGLGDFITPRKKEITVRGMLLNKSDRTPISEGKVWLDNDSNNATNLRENGSFNLYDVLIPESHNIVLSFQIDNGPVYDVYSENLRNIKGDRFNVATQTYNLGNINVVFNESSVSQPDLGGQASIPSPYGSGQIIENPSEPDCNPSDRDCAQVDLIGGNLNMREKPSNSSTLVYKIPNGAFIKVLEMTDKKEKIDGKLGRWLYAMYKGKTGYVFGAFVKYDEPAISPG